MVTEHRCRLGLVAKLRKKKLSEQGNQAKVRQKRFGNHFNYGNKSQATDSFSDSVWESSAVFKNTKHL